MLLLGLQFHRWEDGTSLGLHDALVQIWWFPGIQIEDFFNLHLVPYVIVRPVSNSLLWDAVFFAIWKVCYKRDFRFGLRSLLIATTLMAVLLGLIVYVANP